MIDWTASGSNPDIAKNKDKIIVVCELCKQSRLQLYSVAKRKLIHHCMSCVKSNGRQVKTGEIVEYRCVSCPATKLQKYRPDRFNNWRCHHCAMVKGHEEGKFIVVSNTPSEAGKKRLAQLAKARWADPEYRRKWREARAKTKEERSATSKRIWSDPERLAKLSEQLKRVWAIPEYRSLKTKQSQEQWEDSEYIEKQSTGINDPEVLKVISENSKRFWANSEYREKLGRHLTDCRLNMPTISSIQIKLYELLTELNVDYVSESRETTVGPFSFDCLIPSRKLFIECQGDYWHSLKKNQINDKRKYQYVKSYFPEYDILYLWEHEFENESLIINKLHAIFGQLSSVDFDFKDVVVNRIDYDVAKKIFDNYHYLGSGSGGTAIGAFLGDEMVAAINFTSPMRQTTAGQFGLAHKDVLELSRFCIHPSYHKNNFASWLIAKSCRFINAKLIVAYADTTVGHRGTIYKAAGFQLHHVVPPDFWYITPDNWILHKRTVYGRAIKEGMIESEYAFGHGYLKKFGGEKLCYIKKL